MIRRLIGPNYPKTSCECSECPPNPENERWPKSKSPGDTNNLGLGSCNQLNQIGECTSTSDVRDHLEPSPWLKEDVFEILNPNFGLDVSEGFFIAPDAKCYCPQCPKGRVTSFDSRLISALRGPELQKLDRAPYTGSTRLKDIYEKKLDDYGKNYTNYKTVNGGQIMYYLDRDLLPTYSLPVSTIRSRVKTQVFKTPMGGLWPRYPKEPLSKDSRYISPQQFTRDTVYHREDIMSKQMERFNREKYPLD